MPKVSVLIACLAAAAVVGGLAYREFSGNETAAPPPTAGTQDKSTNTVADRWQWDNFTNTKPAANTADNSKADKPRPKGEMPANVVGIYKIMQSIKLDANSSVVLDDNVKAALEEGFESLGPTLSPVAMAELQKLIRTGLPGPAGEEAARMLENYYRFRLAEAEFIERPVNPNLSLAEQYEKLVQLRRSYLGAETAEKLYAVEDTQGRHMMTSIAIQTNPNLTDEEKQVQQKALQDKLDDRLLAMGLLAPEDAAAEKVQRLREQGASSTDIYAARRAILGAEGARDLAAADREEAKWLRRFNGFWQARRYVMQAGLDDAERERQIEQLLDQYFSPEERDRARATSSEWETRDPK
jgi:lipase chaperone LimK